MKTLIKQLKNLGTVIVLTLVAMMVLREISSEKEFILLCGSGTIAWCVLLAGLNVSEYHTYKKLSARMKGKDLENRLKILYYHEECWLTYASKEEIDWFQKESVKNPYNIQLHNLLDLSYKCKKKCF